MNLYNKYRPRKFSEVIGGNQHQAIKVLQEKVRQNKIPSAILLTGPSGVGKTTIARIFAASVNCMVKDQDSLEPCGDCSRCKAILDDGDFIVIDGSVDTGVDAMRDIVRDAANRSLYMTTKVILFDEMHNLSSKAQDALLTTLEDPSCQTLFLFCTTEPKNILKTIRGRCLQLNLEAPSKHKILNLLVHIAKKEGSNATPDQIDRETGHWENVRDAINRLDIFLSGGSVLELPEEQLAPERRLGALLASWEPITDPGDLGRLLGSLRGSQGARAACIEYLHSCILKSLSGGGRTRGTPEKIKFWSERAKILNRNPENALPGIFTIDVLDALRTKMDKTKP